MKLIRFFLVFIILFTSSCFNPNSNTINLASNKISSEYGNVILRINKDFNKRNATGFNAKSIDFNNKNIKNIKVRVLGHNITQEISETKTWDQNKNTEFRLQVNTGMNRIVVVTALDERNIALSSLMGVINVEKSKDNIANISYIDTLVAQVLYSVIESKYVYIEKVNYLDIRNYITKITGYNNETNKFSKLDPSKLNTRLIAKYIVDNNATIPPDNLADLEGTGKIKLTLNEQGVKKQFKKSLANILE